MKRSSTLRGGTGRLGGSAAGVNMGTLDMLDRQAHIREGNSIALLEYMLND